jgi:hypothetical protein
MMFRFLAGHYQAQLNAVASLKRQLAKSSKSRKTGPPKKRSTAKKPASTRLRRKKS